MLLSLAFLTLLLSTIEAQKHDPYAGGVSIQIMNACQNTVYPAVFTKKGHMVTPTGFKMDHLQVYDLKVPDYWSGTIWVRTSCGYRNNNFHCDVGDCGSNQIFCHNLHQEVEAPVTRLKFNLAPKGGISSYELDLRSGFNVPVTITPLVSYHRCNHITCFKDLKFYCPNWLGLYDGQGGKLACKSACYATKEPKFCCKGAYASEDKCEINEYTSLIKKECPDAVYSDYNQTLFACSGGASYSVVLCP